MSRRRPSPAPAIVPEGIPGAARPVRRRAIVLAVVSLVALGLADRFVERPVAARPETPGVSQSRPEDAIGTTWYCASGIGNAAGGDSQVIIANPTTRTLRGTVTVVPSTGPVQTRPVGVAPASRVVFRPREVVDAPHAAVLVELDRGGAAVDHDVSGPLGFDLAPCATSASREWYLAQGATTRSSSLFLSLFNPFPDDAIVDLRFATDQGSAVPSDLQGLVVPPRSLVVKNIADHVRRREAISTAVIARSGRLVVEQLETRNDPGQRGISLELGAPRAELVWAFPEGIASAAVTERFHLYNPTDREARVDIELTLDAGVVEPLPATVPAQGRLTIVANEEESIPQGVGHSTTIRSLDDVPIVAARSLDVSGARNGRTSDLGGVVSSTTWVFSAGVANEGVDEWVIVQNISGSRARLSVTLLENGQRIPLDRLGGLDLAPGARRGFKINDVIPRANGALLIASTAPVVVERGLYRVGRPGISVSLGVPLSD